MSDGFFVADLPQAPRRGDVVALTGREAHHGATVRRLRLGESVTVTDGLGRGVVGPVMALAPDRVELEVADVVVAPADTFRITVVQALPKNDRADTAVDLMTEIGVAEIVPWQAARSIVRWSGERGEAARSRWRTVARESSKQARRLRFPIIAPLATTHDVAALIGQVSPALLMDERSTTPLTSADFRGSDRCLIVIGPEGGLTDAEVDAFEAVGATALSLGSTILRTSTAGAIAAAMVRTVWQVQRGGIA